MNSFGPHPPRCRSPWITPLQPGFQQILRLPKPCRHVMASKVFQLNIAGGVDHFFAAVHGLIAATFTLCDPAAPSGASSSCKTAGRYTAAVGGERVTPLHKPVNKGGGPRPVLLAMPAQMHKDGFGANAHPTSESRTVEDATASPPPWRAFFHRPASNTGFAVRIAVFLDHQISIFG